MAQQDMDILSGDTCEWFDLRAALEDLVFSVSSFRGRIN